MFRSAIKHRILAKNKEQIVYKTVHGIQRICEKHVLLTTKIIPVFRSQEKCNKQSFKVSHRYLLRKIYLCYNNLVLGSSDFALNINETTN